MSEVKVNKISPRTACGTTTLGDSGDTFNVPCGSKINVASGGNITVASGATITNNGTQTGFGRTGTVDWQTSSIKTSTFTAVNGEGYFCNTVGGSFTCNLPAGSAGAIVSVQDYNNTFDAESLVVTPNGSEKINGGAGSVGLTTEGQGLTLVYIDATVGWRAIEEQSYATQGSNYISASGGNSTVTIGDYKVHVFTGPGTFTVSSAGAPAGSSSVDYMVVGGGGSGGYYNGPGGGGAGGMRIGSVVAQPTIPTRAPGFAVSATAYPITIGAGGATQNYPTNHPSPIPPGSPSTGLGFTATGGGAGGYGSAAGQAGGSGGGGGNAGATGGSGNTPSVSPAQGTNGGNGSPGSGNPAAGGGGGGASAAGTNGACGTSGTGGAGVNVAPVFGAAPQPFYQADGGDQGPTSPGFFAGGAGGSSYSGSGGAGGNGGGGLGVNNGAGPGHSGTANSGGGGSGVSTLACNSGGGGSGMVLIRYKFQN